MKDHIPTTHDTQRKGPYDIRRQTLTYEWERSGSVVECLTRDRMAAGSSLTGVTALWSMR